MFECVTGGLNAPGPFFLTSLLQRARLGHMTCCGQGNVDGNDSCQSKQTLGLPCLLMYFLGRECARKRLFHHPGSQDVSGDMGGEKEFASYGGVTQSTYNEKKGNQFCSLEKKSACGKETGENSPLGMSFIRR